MVFYCSMGMNDLQEVIDRLQELSEIAEYGDISIVSDGVCGSEQFISEIVDIRIEGGSVVIEI